MNTTEWQHEVEQEYTEMMEKLLHYIRESKNHQTAKKLEEVLKKFTSNVVNVGFCGHFSAGKSTMINQLLGKEILPSSPIPTSANLVLIRSGAPHAEIQMTDGSKISIEVEQIDQWKDYCKNGQVVEKVEIFDDHPLLQKAVQLLDTPGVDSTDVAHQAATEAALHLADIIIFVTDYNHVQSENNFNFIKQLKEQGKRVILVINQIDKHRQQEVSLQVFHQRVKEGLEEWGISLDGLLFASMKDPEHPYNQFNQLVGVFQQIEEQKEQILQQQLIHAVHVLLDEHARFLLQLSAQEREEIQSHIQKLKAEVDWEADPTWLEKYHQSEQAPKRFRDEIKNEMEKTLSNAIIMPYTTTQLAQQLIESYQKDFKIGWLFSSKKTEEERQKRLQELYQDLSEKVTSQIEWHLKELVRKKSEVFQLDAQEYLTSIMEWSLQIPREWLVQEIKTDIVSREYVYHYTNEVAKKVHQLYRNKIESLIEEGSALLQERHQIMYSSAQESLAKWGQLEQLEQKEKGIEEKVEQQIAVYRDELVSHLPHGSKQLHFEITELRMNESQKDEESKKTQEQTQSNRDQHLKLNSEGLLRVARQLEHAATLLADIPSFHPLVQDFREKAERLKNNRFTVCLFGAFSAGKSSFANALMGQGVLPVSPNPTTAAINQVLPATAENPAGTAMIKMKSRHQVEEEIRISLQRLLLPIQHSEQESLQQIEKLKPHELRPSLKPYYSFLLACHKGWEEAQAIIGTQFKVDKAEFAQFVAVEQKACFVESIQLFHDSYLAQNGVELIDTPGADSIYSRHTNVTFNYIKNADVILYVTYYNHAFSKADRDFLDQLGRVKDQFALDKMFFMVNASDLAASEEELHDVVQHVEQNLLQSGIRFPRIYPVSSIRALEGEAHSGMEEFEAAFFSFLQDDLAQILVESAERDIEKAYVLLDEMRKELLTSTEVREAKIDDLNRKEQEWQEQIQNEKYPSVANELEKEVQELLYYVKQRVFFNFQRHLNDSFHPSVLSQERTGKKELQQCLEELLFSLLHQIKDECKATSLRLEKMLDRILDRMIVEWQRKTENEKMVLKGAHIHRPSFEVPLLPENFMSIPTKELEGSFAHFKNPKYFFEQGGKALLRTELEKRLQVTVDSYLEAVQELFIAFYLKAWQQVEAAMKQGLSEEIKMAVESKRFALRGEISVAQLDQMMKAYQDSIVGDVER